MSNKVLFGLKNVHVALLTAEAGPTYGEPMAVPGGVNFTSNPDGGLNKFYADNVAYFTTSDNNGYSGELEMANITDEVLAALLNWEIDDNGMLVEIADAQPAQFALLCEFAGDESARRVVYYNCVAARPGEAQATKGEQTTPSTRTLSLSIMPLAIDVLLDVKGAIEKTIANSSVYEAWYEDVTLPSFAVS